jgi:3-oxoacyl-[acyl-carrier-protein] synthase II
MLTPLGRNTEETFERASRGLSGIDHIRSFDTRGLPCGIGGEVDDAWLDGFREPGARRLENLASRGARLMAVATAEAAQQARLGEIADRESIGVALGSHGDNPSVQEVVFLHRFYRGEGRWDLKGLMQAGGYPYSLFFRRKPDLAMAILAGLFDCRGSTLSIVSACAAGAQAIGEAARTIREGRAEAMIAGGCEATLDFMGLAGFTLIKALAERYRSPQKASRPFDRKRSGFVMSEGAGAVVLEELEHARARRAPILGEVLGYGDSADAYRITDSHPRGEGAILAMQGALEDASRSPEEVDYINAHGTSTQQNDAVETLAIKAVFGPRAKAIPVSSNKSMLGHTIAAAGAIECILTLAGIQRSLILPTINYEFPDPKCDLDYVPNAARHQRHQLALSNSFGFGGQNACLCLGAWQA